MKAPLLWLAAVILLTSCGSAWKLKRAQRLINSAIENGAQVDSLKTVKYDTIRIKELETKLEYIRTVDTVKLIEKCKELIRKPVKAGVRAIQKEICPEIAIDSAFLTTLSVQDKIVRVLIRVTLNAKEGHISGSLSVPPISVPFESERTTVGVSSGYTLWGVIFRCAVCSIILAAIVFALCKLKIL